MLTRGSTLGWAHRLKAVALHEASLVNVEQLQRPDIKRREFENDVEIIAGVIDGLDKVEVPACEDWAVRLVKIVDRQRGVLEGMVILHDARGDIAELEAIAAEIEAAARNLATTGEYSLPVDPNADTVRGITPPDPEDD